MVNPYPDIPAELPGVRLESDFVNEKAAVEPTPGPSDAEIAAAALRNAGLAETTGVPRKTTGVKMTIDLSDDDSDEEDEVASLVDAESNSDGDSDDEGDDNDDDAIVEDVKDKDLDETPTVATPLSEMLGRGMRIRKSLHLMSSAQRAKV